MSEHHHHDHDHPHSHEHGHDHDHSHEAAQNHNYGPSSTGSVVLEMGGDIGILILNGPADLLGREIEISSVDAPAGAKRPHSMVRERVTGAGVSYAALYVDVPAGTYNVWRDATTPAGTVTVRGGEISTFEWDAVSPQPEV